MGGSPGLRVFLTYRYQRLKGVGTERSVKLPCVLKGDSRGCGAEPPVHVRHDVERSFCVRPAVSLPSGSLLSSSGVSRPDMIVRLVVNVLGVLDEHRYC